MLSESGFRPKRACEICRKRKLRCFLSKVDSVSCRLCELYGRQCKFPESASSVNKIKKGRIRESKTTRFIPGSSILNVQNGSGENLTPQDTSEVEVTDNVANATNRDHHKLSPQAQTPSDILQGWFMNNSNPFPVSPLENIADGESDYNFLEDLDTTVPDYDCLTASQLHKTLGLQCNRHLSYIGSTGQLDSLLLSLYEYNSNNTANFIDSSPSIIRTIRKVQELSNDSRSEMQSKRTIGECEAFVLIEQPIAQNYHDDASVSPTSRLSSSGWIPMSPETMAEVKQIQEMVGNLGPKLMDLFVTHVLPCYPIIHKTTLLDKYDRSVYELAPSILGALYYFSLNWLAYDIELTSAALPSEQKLEKLSKDFFAREVPKPTISTVQAGLLFLQHDIYIDERTGEETPSWPLLFHVIGASYEIGLHLDSSNWDIPHWEKFLRKRLAWAVYIQDKWTALISGRPPSIQEENWAVTDIVAERDFPDLLTSEGSDGDSYELSKITVNVTSSILLFSEMIKLSKIVSQMLQKVFCAKHWTETYDQSSIDQKIVSDLELVKGYHLQLRDWYQSIPQRLKSGQTQDGEFSPDGNLHIAFYSAELSLFRHLLKLLARSESPDLLTLRQYVHQASFDLWIAAIDTVVNLKSQQLQSFWYSFSKYNLSLFVTFGFLLFVVMEDNEKKKKILKRMEIYRWSLVLYSKSASFMKHAVFWIDHYSSKLKLEIVQVKQS